MALSDAIAALFGWRRVVVYDHSVVAATIQGMDAYAMYRKQPALRAVVSFLADNVAGISLKCYERRGDSDRPRDTESDLARLLSRPCKGMTTHELVRAIVSDYLLAGDALCYLYDDPDAPAGRWLHYFPWSWVHGKETRDGFEPSGYRVTNPYTGRTVTVPAEDCIRFFSYDPRGAMESSSAIEALKDVLSEQLSAWEYRNGVWKNGGRVSQWISRPANAPWEPGARERFAKSWKSRFAGKDGTDTGGTPLLEDGMRLETTTFNAREAQWQEATKLAREDVAAVYHVNPAQVWHTDSQTYASAKDNARALYADTLTPLLDMIEERLNGFLVPMLGMDPATHYCEFDLSSKLAASFEEQAGVLQSSVGGPFMLRNEARARMNLPAIEGGDELIVPLNVTEGGLASPRDTDPTVERYNARPALDVHVEPLAKGGDAAPFGDVGSTKELRIQVKASPKVMRSLVDVFSNFFKDESRYLSAELSRIPPEVDDLDAEIRRVFAARWSIWVERLTNDMVEQTSIAMNGSAMRTLSLLGLDPDILDQGPIDAYLKGMCERRAKGIVANSVKEVKEKLPGAEDWTPASVRKGVGAAIGRPMMDNARRNATSLATEVANAGAVEGARQSGVRCQKEWVALGHNTRDAHALVSGTRVDLDGVFDLGGVTARWPGDSTLPPELTCNCHCRIDIVAGGKALYREARTREIARRLGLESYDEASVENAALRCQRRLGMGDRLWDDLTNAEQNGVLTELRSRDQEWVATGTCRRTRIAARPEAAAFRMDSPAEYADWQDLVSRASRLTTSDKQAKHIYGSGDFDGTSSYFVIGGADDNEMLLALRLAVDGLIGTGIPYGLNGKLTEVVETGSLESWLIEAGRPGEGFKTHYAPAQDGGTIHVVPWTHYIP
ncbi:MAG: phage portal protein [Atopobiaceae bacterium]|nr:phage portal protein [Atopobiaceae bacterium]